MGRERRPRNHHIINPANREPLAEVPREREADGLSDGFFLKPTVLDGMVPDDRLAQEEIFGPVLGVLIFETVQEAVSIANGTEYGLIAEVWTNEVNKAHWGASRVKVRQVFVNNYGACRGIEIPFGGYGKNGFEHEKGLETLRGYTQIKYVAVKLHSKDTGGGELSSPADGPVE